MINLLVAILMLVAFGVCVAATLWVLLDKDF